MSALVSAARKVLDRNSVRFVVVGGQAIYLRVHTSTSDVDVIVATPEYEAAVTRLSSDTDVAGSDRQGGTSFIHLKTAGGARLDILDAANYSGDRPGAEFFRYVVEEGSIVKDGVRYATVPVVWYMRLVIDPWETYAEKLLTNVVDGIGPVAPLREVGAIGRRFGTAEKLANRLAFVRNELKRPNLEDRLADSRDASSRSLGE